MIIHGTKELYESRPPLVYISHPENYPDYKWLRTWKFFDGSFLCQVLDGEILKIGHFTSLREEFNKEFYPKVPFSTKKIALNELEQRLSKRELIPDRFAWFNFRSVDDYFNPNCLKKLPISQGLVERNENYRERIEYTPQRYYFSEWNLMALKLIKRE